MPTVGPLLSPSRRSRPLGKTPHGPRGPGARADVPRAVVQVRDRGVVHLYTHTCYTSWGGLAVYIHTQRDIRITYIYTYTYTITNTYTLTHTHTHTHRNSVHTHTHTNTYTCTYIGSAYTSPRFQLKEGEDVSDAAQADICFLFSFLLFCAAIVFVIFRVRFFVRHRQKFCL
jgi:hypothetical protein